MATVCCFNPPPPTAPPTTATRPPPSARPKREISWRSQCVVGMAIAMVGLPIVVGDTDHDGYAFATEVVESKVKGKRWSSKRICPAWQLNSLETIVPEDLPRPSFKRRWESVGDHHSRDAPPVQASTTIITPSDCFSM